MADEDLNKGLEINQQALERGTEATRKFARTLRSTAQTFVKHAKNDKDRAAIIRQHIQFRERELKGIKGNSDAAVKHRKAVTDDIEATKQLGKAFKVTTGTMATFNQFMGEMGMETKISGKGIIKAFKDTALRFGRADIKIEGVADALKDFDNSIKFMGYSFKDFGDMIDFNANMYKTLAQSGATFGKSIIALRTAAGDARMPILDFMDLIQTNTPTMAKLFGTVDNGVASMATFARNLRTRTMNELSQFGFNLEETSEFLGTVLEMERARGNADRIRTMDMVGITVEYTKNLTRLSKLTGQSVKELDDANKKMAVQGAFQSQLLSMGPKQRNEMTQMVTAMGGMHPAFQQFAEEMIALGAPISKTSQEIEAMSGGALSNAIKAYKNQEIGLEELMNQVKTVSSEAIKGGKSFGAASYATGVFTEAMNAFASGAGLAVKRLDSEMSAPVKDFTDKVVSAKDQVALLEGAAERTGTAIVKHMLPAVDGFVRALGTINDYMGDGKGLSDFVDTSIGAVKVWVVGWGTKIWEGIKGAGGAVKKDWKERTTDDKGLSRFWSDNKEANSTWDILTPWNTEAEKQKKLNAVGSPDMSTRAMGTSRATSMFSEPATKILEVHKGEKVLNQNETLAYKDTSAKKEFDRVGGGDMILSQLTTVNNDILKSSTNIESHLNKLIAINMSTERNTKSTHKGLAELSGTLV